jgi:hypothetical protein
MFLCFLLILVKIGFCLLVKRAHPEAVLISGRFYLIKELTEAAKNHTTRVVGAKFRIAAPMGNDAYNSDYWSKPKELPPDLPEKQHMASAEKKRAVAEQVRKLILTGYSISAPPRNLAFQAPLPKNTRRMISTPLSRNMGPAGKAS